MILNTLPILPCISLPKIVLASCRLADRQQGVYNYFECGINNVSREAEIITLQARVVNSMGHQRLVHSRSFLRG